jgi:hypothetical protein
VCDQTDYASYAISYFGAPLSGAMKPGFKTSLRLFVLEFLVYGALVIGYYFAVLHFLGDWLHHLFESERRVYAALALGLIIAQGFLLEMLTRLLLTLVQPRMENK